MYKHFKKKYYVNTFFCSIANLKCTPSDRQMYPWGYMYPRLGTSVLRNQQIFRKYIIFSFLTECLRGPDETVSRAGFGPRAVVWRPLA